MPMKLNINLNISVKCDENCEIFSKIKQQIKSYPQFIIYICCRNFKSLVHISCENLRYKCVFEEACQAWVSWDEVHSCEMSTKWVGMVCADILRNKQGHENIFNYHMRSYSLFSLWTGKNNHFLYTRNKDSPP